MRPSRLSLWALTAPLIVASGCWSLDARYDPRRCDPACEDDKICVNGQCLAPDHGPDAGGPAPDSASPAPDSGSPGPDGGPVCGDGDKESGEQCDGDDLDLQTCVSLGLAPGTLSCTADCRLDTSECPTCGNFKVDGIEECDGWELGGKTCASLGLISGTLSCHKTDHEKACTFDTSDCNSNVLDPDGVELAVGTHQGSLNAAEAARVAHAAGKHLVVWLHDRGGANEIRALRVDATTGKPLESKPIVVSSGASESEPPAVASYGSGFLIVWTDSRDGSADIHGARLDAAGTVLDPASIKISDAPGGQYSARLIGTDAGFFVAWSDARGRATSDWDVYGARVTQNGQVLDPSGIKISDAAGRQRKPALGWDGSSVLVAWEDGRNEASASFDVYGARLSAAGQVQTAEVAISTGAAFEGDVAVAGGTGGFLVVWEDGRAGSVTNEQWDIYAARIDATGKLLDSGGIAVQSTSATQHTDPEVSFDGTHYLVVWEEEKQTDDDILVRRVGINGVPVDAAPVPVAAFGYNQVNPTVARGANSYYVIWNESRTFLSSGTWDIYGARVIFP